MYVGMGLSYAKNLSTYLFRKFKIIYLNIFPYTETKLNYITGIPEKKLTLLSVQCFLCIANDPLHFLYSSIMLANNRNKKLTIIIEYI